MEDFWKDDFRPLQWAGKTILQALRDDEDAADADLYRRLTQSQEGSHLYFRPDTASSSSSSSASPPAAGSNAYPYQQGNGGLNGGGRGAASSFASPPPPSAATPAATSNAAGTTPPIVSLKHRQSLPLPSLLTDALKQVQTCSFMGLLLPVDMAWMTVDSKLFLFSSENPAQGTIQCFENPRKQPILAVALVKPKQGVFKDVVEWCVVVTTPEEVILLALARYADTLKIIPTSFMMPTDLIRMQCAVGTEDGRVFLGGDDGCVHEMIYEDQTAAGYENGFTYGSNGGHDKKVEELLNDFYDGTAVLPDVVNPSSTNGSGIWTIGKRTLQSVTSSGGGSPRKTRKLNRTTQASSVVTALVPNVIRQASTAMFGGPTAQQGGRIIRLVADPERETLYSLSEKGWISVMDISQPKAAPVVAVCDVPKTVRLYLEAVSRGQMFPPSNSSSTVGSIHFPGGGAAAQAGVGGMEGARNILKQADWQRNQQSSAQAKGSNKSTTHPIITPVALHVIPCQDSARLTVMAVTGGGLRLYFSALSSSILTSGGNVSLSTGSRMRTLGSRLSLCHIRSPPPLNMSQSGGMGSGAAMWSADVAGGLLPRVSGNSISRVDASYYKDGQWVVAMEDTTEAVGSDIVVAATPDTAFRPREGTDGRRVTEPTGGLGESITFPIAASHDNGRDGSFRALSGGLVWEIDSDNKEKSGALDLLLHSPTPSNVDLDSGLPPVFYPPSQIRHSKPAQKIPSSESRAMVLYNPSTRTSLMQALANVVLNPFGVRPLNYGINEQGQGNAYSQPAYRVSQRTGEQGFSMSAAERRLNTTVVRASASSSKKAQATKQAKAARLRQWLLQPPVKSLNQWTKQHLFGGKKMVTALNVHGVHKFEFDSILSSLADTIMAAGDNVAHDSRISSFFNGYGFKEGCAMCLALAIGCGLAEGIAGYNQQLSRRAVSAALARTYNPRLSREDVRVTNTGSSLSTTNATDSCVPVGYIFFPSTLSEGLFSLVSRLTRPIWHKPLVVVTEGRSVKAGRWDLGTKLTSVKVEVLLCDKTLEQMRGPLQALLSLVRDVFSTAINAVPGFLGQQSQSMEIDGVEQSQYLTQSLQYHSQFRNTNRDSSSQLSPKECDNVARLLEERNIHSMYRLISRVVQLLNLLALLRKSEGIAGLPQVDWGLLHGVTVSQLVQSAEGHDRLETLLNELVVATAETASSSPMAAQADFLATQLAQQCYLYFPPSSRFTYQGLRLAKQALSHPSGSSQRKEIGMKAAKQLMDAARHWQSASLISGRLVRGNGKENYIQIASRAIQYSSPLARSVDLLLQLEDLKSKVSNAVAICLTTSQNFKALATPGVPRDAVRYEGMLAWEGDLYHKHVDARASDAQRMSNGPQQTSQTEVFGTGVTAEDAIDTCYALIFYHLDGLLRSNRELADLMIQTACSAVEDSNFLTRLFSFLMESSNVDTLLRINSPEAEYFLKSQSDPNLLWRHYSVLNKFAEAGQVAIEKATADGPVGLEIRIEWLTKALSSYRSAQNVYRQPTSSASNDPLSKSVSETEDLLRLASLQNRVLMRISGLPEFPETIDPVQYEEAKTCLLKASPLYNQFIAAAPFFDLGLVIFHMCRYDDPEAIRNLWKSALCAEILPCGTRRPTIFHSLQEFAADVGVADGVSLLTDKMEAEGLSLFESGDWVVPVKELVIRLGREIYGTGADYTFPIHFVMEKLELLRCIQGSGISPGWPLLTLAAAGVPYPRVLEAYETLPRNESNSGDDASDLIVRISGSFELLNSWVSESRSAGQAAGQHSTARADLSRSMSTGDLMPRLNALRSILEQMQGPGAALLEQLNTIEDHISYLVTM